MRLINVHTLDFDEFEGENVPKYAILSHRWEQEEVLFKNMINSTANRKKGFGKIRSCCHQAAKDGLRYAWIDTCCIDKSSSAELSEAINAMFTWYRNAETCYVYLSDVDATTEHPTFEHLFKQSVRFSRGWTLQELIAPRRAEFFNSQWVHIDSLLPLRFLISEATSVPTDVLLHTVPLPEVPIAQRMSWAANRQTTRVEDRAYSLMGIFDVNMPMMYGEGENAFRRLQEEIVRRTNDHSILLFQRAKPTLFASSPAEFEILSLDTLRGGGIQSKSIWPAGRFPGGIQANYRQYQESEPSAMTNLGLSVSLPIFPWYSNVYIALVAVIRSYSIRPSESLDLLCFIYLTRSRSPSRMHRTSWNNESVKCIRVNEYTQLYPGSPKEYSWLEENTKRIVIASVPSDFEPRPETIVLELNHCPVWHTERSPKAADVISRSKWTSTPELRPTIPYEILAIIRVNPLPTGQKGYVYITYDGNFDICVIYKERVELLESYFDPTVKTLDHDMRVYLDPNPLWSWIRNNDDAVEYQVIKCPRWDLSSYERFTQPVLIRGLGIKNPSIEHSNQRTAYCSERAIPYLGLKYSANV